MKGMKRNRLPGPRQPVKECQPVKESRELATANASGAVKTGPAESRREIAEAFGEYRRLIGDIRLRHGRRSRRSLLG